MNVQEYINSGIIEDYCLGVLTPEEMKEVAHQAMIHDDIKFEIEAYESALKEYAGEFARDRKKDIKKNLFDIFDNLETEEDIHAENLPLINKYSSAENWLRFVKPLLPAKLEEPSMVHELPAKDGVDQFIFWTNEGLPYEIHKTTHETLLVLEGRCVCYIEDEVHELNPGDFLCIPLHKSHNVEIVNGPVMAVIQRIKVA